MISLTTPCALEFNNSLRMIQPKMASAAEPMAANIHGVAGDTGGAAATAGCCGKAPSGESGGCGPQVVHQHFQLLVLRQRVASLVPKQEAEIVDLQHVGQIGRIAARAQGLQPVVHALPCPGAG